MAQLADDLLREYAATVDNGSLEEWPNLFADEACYQVILRRNVMLGRPVSLVLDDSKAKIQDRVIIIRRLWADKYSEYQSRHFWSVTKIAAINSTELRVQANLSVYATEQDGTSALLLLGQSDDRIVISAGEPRLKLRRVIVDTDVLPRYFVYPV
jgi:anthranilate 1,2-dioxygenase small subunit